MHEEMRSKVDISAIEAEMQEGLKRLPNGDYEVMSGAWRWPHYGIGEIISAAKYAAVLDEAIQEVRRIHVVKY
jgi:hypothetical protein